MFRRRRLARYPGRPAERLRRALRRANDLKNQGDYEEAGKIFEHLAKGAQDRGNHKQAPFLYLQAAHCYLLTAQSDRAVGLMSHGLRLLADTSRWLALQKAGDRSIAVLRDQGQDEVADKVQDWLDKTLADHQDVIQAAMAPPSAGKPAPKAPAKCPYCGASMRSDQFEWIDSSTAECLYCGSAVDAVE